MSTGRLRTWLPTSHSEAHEAARDCLRRIVRATRAGRATRLTRVRGDRSARSCSTEYANMRAWAEAD
jgi:hypothetical protein